MKLNIQRVPPSEFAYPGVTALRYETQKEEKGETITEYNITLYKDQEVLAWLVLTPMSEFILQIRNRYMDNGACGSEVEEKLLQYIEIWARQNGFHNLAVSSCMDCIPFYRRLGYIPIGAEFVEAGMVHQRMEKPLVYT